MTAPQKSLAHVIETLKTEAARVPTLERENAELRAQLDEIQRAAGLAPAKETASSTTSAPSVPIPLPTTDMSPGEIRTIRAEAIRAYLINGGHLDKSNAQIGAMFGVAESTIRRTIWELVQAGTIKPRERQIRRKRRPNGYARKAA